MGKKAPASRIATTKPARQKTASKMSRSKSGRDERGRFVKGQSPPVGGEYRFKPGHPGGPGRRRGAGLSIREWLNDLVYATEPELQQIVDNPNGREPAARRAAAGMYLDALCRRDDGGQPIDTGRRSLVAIIEQTAGKPVQSVEISEPEGDVRDLVGALASRHGIPLRSPRKPAAPTHPTIHGGGQT